jgi:ABC-2 type transport system ATP-binding protein
MIEVTNLKKQYGSHRAVDGVSFEAKQGEILGLLGPNGAGKTTTMRVLTGFMPPTSGTVSVAGYDVMEDSMEVRRRVGYLPEKVPVYPDMTLFNYVSFVAKLHNVKNHKQKVDEVLDRFELLDRRNKLVRSLSKGLKQRLGLAQALVHDPPVIVLDEPTIGIDPKQVIEVRDIVKNLGNDHTVLFSSHVLTEVEQVCDRVVIINKGKVVAQGTAKELGQQFNPQRQLYVELDGGNEEAYQRLLQGLDMIEKIEPQGRGFVLHIPSDDTIQKPITRVIADSDFTLIEMRQLDVSLEDVFLDIISKGEQ